MRKSSEFASPLIINAALTGCVLGRRDSPHIPITREELVADAVRVTSAGASILHVHARKEDGSPSFDETEYSELVAALRSACPDVLVCVSLSGRHESRVERRAAALASKPDLATLTLGSMNFITGPSVNAPDVIVELARRIDAAGAIPELEVFDAGFIHYARFLSERGILREPLYFNIILGSLGTAPFDLPMLGHLISMLPAGATWSVGGLGRYQRAANVAAIAAGGHVRVGLEDNLYYDDARTDLADHARLVERVVRIARECGREPATPEQARALLGRAAVARTEQR
jgi:3-keto-5-aminohexanoate cleavage enzyme